jgi:hypothetical protein
MRRTKFRGDRAGFNSGFGRAFAAMCDIFRDRVEGKREETG